MILSNKKGLAAFLHETGAGHLPDIAGCYSGKKLVICADGACVWDDLEKFGCRSDDGRGRVKKPGWDFMVINKLGETFPGDIEHWYSNAPHLLQKFMAARRDEYEKEFAAPKHTHSCQSGAMWHWPFGGQGTSGLGAALVGVALGYAPPIILAGLPLDDGPHNGEPSWRRTKFASSEAKGKNGGPDPHWKRAIELVFQGKVKSLSGRTRDWLGAP